MDSFKGSCKRWNKIAFVDHTTMTQKICNTTPDNGQGNTKVMNTAMRITWNNKPSLLGKDTTSIQHNSKNSFKTKSCLQRNTFLWKLHLWKRELGFQNIRSSQAMQKLEQRLVGIFINTTPFGCHTPRHKNIDFRTKQKFPHQVQNLKENPRDRKKEKWKTRETECPCTPVTTITHLA